MPWSRKEWQPSAVPQRRGVALGAAMLLVLAIGAVDHLTGWEISFSIFYFIPVSLAAWYVSREAGIATSVASALVWLAADVAAHPPYFHPAIPLWNGGVRLLLFLVMTFYLSLFRKTLEREHEMARTDALTGLANTRAFFETAARELARCDRYGRPLSVAYIDVDDFKTVNDTEGHLAGDELLRLLADVLRERTRVSDFVARMGGDEFVILLPEARAEDAIAAVRNIRLALEERRTERGRRIRVSIGVLTCETPPPSVDDLVHRSDELMYRAKRAGKDSIRHEILSADETKTATFPAQHAVGMSSDRG